MLSFSFSPLQTTNDNPFSNGNWQLATMVGYGQLGFWLCGD
jgi:hypothetical protein